VRSRSDAVDVFRTRGGGCISGEQPPALHARRRARKAAALAVGLFGLAAGSTRAEAGGVEVLVSGVRDARGYVLVTL
jgi:hypothetical protein